MQADIISFLANATRNVANRLEDAGHQITSGAYDSLVGIGKNMKEAGGDVLGGLGNIAEGTFGGMTSPIGSSKFNDSWKRFGEGGRQFGKGMGKGLLQTPLDAFALNFLKHLSAFQTVSFFESAGRLLLPSEETLLSSIFGNSVVYGAIRIKSGYAGAIHLGEDSSNELGKYWLYNTRPITIGNTIYMKDTDPLGWDATLVHETTHVWQHQNGGTDYMSEALYAQFTAGYGYGDDIFNKNKTWAMLNPEQQGQLIEDAFKYGYFSSKQWNDSLLTQAEKQRLINYMTSVIPQLLAGQGQHKYEKKIKLILIIIFIFLGNSCQQKLRLACEISEFSQLGINHFNPLVEAMEKYKGDLGHYPEGDISILIPKYINRIPIVPLIKEEVDEKDSMF